VSQQKQEEQTEHDITRARAAKVLQANKPWYVEDLEGLIGLAPDSNLQEPGGGNLDGEMEDMLEPDMDAEEESEEGSATEEAEIAAERAAKEGAQKARAKEQVMRDQMDLLRACATGKHMRMQALLHKNHVSVDKCDSYGRSALYFAAERGHTHLLQTLCAHHATVDIRTSWGWTPLHAATFNGHVRCMEVLLEQAHAAVDEHDNHGCTPLVLAASSPKLYMIDLVSRTDRRKRRKVRSKAYQRELAAKGVRGGQSIARAATSFVSSPKGMFGQSASSVAPVSSMAMQLMEPDQVWQYYPNHIEMIVLSVLFKYGAKVDECDFRRRSPLIYAARYGHKYTVSRLLHAKARVHMVDADERSALYHAASNEHIEIVDMLIRAGAQINNTDSYFRTPLHGALMANDEAMATLLLKAEAAVNAYDCEGNTPIMMAMDMGNRRIFSTLIDRRSSLDVLDKRGWNVVVYAIETDMLSEVLPILQKLGEMSRPILRTRDPQGRNAMHHAVQLENVRAATAAVTKIYELDNEVATFGDCNGDTAIHYACELGRLDVVRILLQNQPSSDYQNHRGETPLMYSANGGHLACFVALLRDQGYGAAASADAVDVQGRSVLMHACASGHLDLVNLMLQNREGDHPELAIPPVEINHVDNDGVTALMVSSREGHWHLLPSLVIAGANVAAKDDDGFNALQWAAVEEEPLATATLIDLGAQVNSAGGRGWTALMHAVAKGNNEVVQLLVDAGADLDSRNWDGDTALQICARYNDAKHKVTKDLLIDGLLDRGGGRSIPVVAQGHFMVSVLRGTDFYLEGNVRDMNTYVCLQFCMKEGTPPLVAFSSCSMGQTSPEWNEVFRFESEQLHPSAFLVAWVLAAPGETPEEVMEGAAYGLSDEQIVKLRMQRITEGVEPRQRQVDYSTAMHNTFGRLMRRADKEADNAQWQAKRLLGTEEETKKPFKGIERSLVERRWLEVENLQKVLKKTGLDLPDPLSPRTHLPLGCVIVRFRHLRGAVWGTEPVVIDRALRLGCRGSLTLEVDFRPRFFVAFDPQKYLGAEELEEIQTPRYNETDDLQDAIKEERMADKKGIPAIDKLGFRVQDTRGTTSHIRQQQDPATTYTRFMQWSVWSYQVQQARKLLGGEADETAAAQEEAARAARRKRIRKRFTVREIVKAFKARQQRREKVMNMKLQARSGGKTTPSATSTRVQRQTKQKEGEKAALLKIPMPRGGDEPWMEVLLDGTRLI